MLVAPVSLHSNQTDFHIFLMIVTALWVSYFIFIKSICTGHFVLILFQNLEVN